MRIPNIGPRGQARRRKLGYIMLGVAVAVALLLIAFQAPRSWRLMTMVPLWAGALGFFQARDKT